MIWKYKYRIVKFIFTTSFLSWKPQNNIYNIRFVVWQSMTVSMLCWYIHKSRANIYADEWEQRRVDIIQMSVDKFRATSYILPNRRSHLVMKCRMLIFKICNCTWLTCRLHNFLVSCYNCFDTRATSSDHPTGPHNT